MACGRAAEAPSGREPAGLYACDLREGRHRGGAQGKQGPGVRPVRRGGAARRTVIDAGVEDQGAADRQAALQVGVAAVTSSSCLLDRSDERRRDALKPEGRHRDEDAEHERVDTDYNQATIRPLFGDRSSSDGLVTPGRLVPRSLT